MAAVKPPEYLSDEQRWLAVRDRVHEAGGRFLYGVLTTGVFCRPGCASRRPRRENVRYFQSPAEARAAGFRACRRCLPESAQPDAEPALVARACALMDRTEASPTRAALAALLGVSETHLARAFKRSLGVTPAGYWRMRRAQRLSGALESGRSVTTALHEAGFGSASRLYADDAGTTLGMSPSRYRDGAPGEPIEWATAPCSLGQVLVAVSRRGVCAIELGDDAARLYELLERRFDKAALVEAGAQGLELLAAVVALVEHPQTPASLPLDIRGTAFQRRVWQALREIPAGRTLSYGGLAERLGMARSARAVAAAVAANRLAVAIPCHRVIGADGELHGYRWGLERKQRLLQREAARGSGKRD